MLTIILSLFSSARRAFQTRAALQAEILALRHQLLVLQRSSRGHRLRLSRADRFLWVWRSRLWSGWRSALLIVSPRRSSPGIARDSDRTGGGRVAIRKDDCPYRKCYPANAFEISEIQERQKNRKQSTQDSNNVTLLYCIRRLATVLIRQRHLFSTPFYPACLLFPALRIEQSLWPTI